MISLLPNCTELTKKQEVRLKSYYRSMFSIIEAHHKNNLDVNDMGSKLALRYLIRFIDDLFKFRISKGVYENCIKIQEHIEEESYMTKRERGKINNKLKKAGIDDSIQIEHLEGGVKSFIECLLHPSIDKNLISSAQRIKKLHLSNTKCLIKMAKQEKDLNDKSNEEEIIKYIY